MHTQLLEYFTKTIYYPANNMDFVQIDQRNDFSKAFDSLIYVILLSKLKLYMAFKKTFYSY